MRQNKADFLEKQTFSIKNSLFFTINLSFLLVFGRLSRTQTFSF